jgi:phage baseplate assembly protein gpV
MSPSLRALAQRLGLIERRLVEQDQRLARQLLRGKVKEVRKKDGDWQVRVDLGQAGSDEPVLSPWVHVQPASSGALKIKVKPTEGEAMTVLSPSGVVGSGSWAVRSPFTDTHPAPEGDEDVVIERGETRLTIEDGKVVMSTGDARIELAGGDIKISGKIEIHGDVAIDGGSLTHKGANIGNTHRHINVMPGLAISGPPQPGAST